MKKPSSIDLPILGGLPGSVYDNYQTIRYSKMFNNKMRTDHQINFDNLLKNLKTNSRNFVKLRIHYLLNEEINVKSNQNSLSVTQALSKYQKRFKIDFIYSNEEYEVIDIQFGKELVPIYLSDPKFKTLLEESALVEIYSEKTAQKTFLGTTTKRNIPMEYVISKNTYMEPPIIKHIGKPEYIELWVSLLQEKWNEFYKDVKDKECSLVYYTKGNFAIRRKFLDGQPAIFTTQEDLLLLQELQVTAIIPNCHTYNLQGRPLSVEAVIDIDPS